MADGSGSAAQALAGNPAGGAAAAAGAAGAQAPAQDAAQKQAPAGGEGEGGAHDDRVMSLAIALVMIRMRHGRWKRAVGDGIQQQPAPDAMYGNTLRRR